MDISGVLYVEGMDDLYVTEALVTLYGVCKPFVITTLGGCDNMQTMLSNGLKAARFNDTIKDVKYDFDIRRIGVVVDANGNREKRIRDFNKALESNGYMTMTLSEDGCVIHDDSKDVATVGLWIMPDNNHAGMIEDFYRHFIPADDLLLPEVNAFIDHLKQNPDIDSPAPETKAVVRTWLACQKKSESLMGFFLQNKKNRLDIHNDLAERFIGWINNVFNT